MTLKKLLAVSVLTTSLLCTTTPMYAASTVSPSTSIKGTFSTIPDAKELERQKQYELAPPTAWEVDTQGNKKIVPYIVPSVESANTQSFTDANYSYVFQGFTINNTKQDAKRFFVDKITIENNSPGLLPIKYIQQESVTNEWSVGTNIEAEAEFKVSFLASLKAKLGGSFTASKTTLKSTTIEAGPKNVPPGVRASYTKYRSGGYGAGQAAWKKYPKGSGSLVGMYYTGESGWAINEAAATISYNEEKI